MRASREKLKDYTERAVRATLDGAMIPPVVYIPAGLRKRKVRVREEYVMTPPSEDEIDLKIAAADPAGMLIAIMQGQPIPVFKLEERDNKIVVTTDYEIPDLALRASVATDLIERKRRRDTRAKKGTPEYESMIARAAEFE
jgi:hypothetical protein